jgi:hypothetical protein
MNAANPRRPAQVSPAGTWKRSVRCGSSGGNCVEVSYPPSGPAAVRRTSPDPASTLVLVFEPAAWHGFVAATRVGDFDR